MKNVFTEKRLCKALEKVEALQAILNKLSFYLDINDLESAKHCVSQYRNTGGVLTDAQGTLLRIEVILGKALGFPYYKNMKTPDRVDPLCSETLSTISRLAEVASDRLSYFREKIGVGVCDESSEVSKECDRST